ncbi:MAG: proton-conducting transporter membrane subunit [Polyangiales bacterium]
MTLVASPRAALTPGTRAAVLATLAAALGVYASVDPWLLAAFWTLSLAPDVLLLRARGEALVSRLHGLFALGSVAPLVAGLALLSRHAAPEAAFALLASALLLRKAVFPFHGWLPVLVSRAPIPMLPLTLGTHLGAFLVIRVMIPALPPTASRDLTALADLALFSALYASVAALAQRDLRRLLGYVIASQLCLVPVGLAMMDVHSAQGSLLQMFAVGMTSTGLLLLTGALEARVGRVDLGQVGGLVARYPRAANLFLILALAAGGFPASLHFVAEDVILHALLHRHPVVATVFLLATVLNGITLLLAYFRAFHGPLRGDPGGPIPDLRARELAPLALLAALIFASGLAPQGLLSDAGASIHALLDAAAAHR